MKQSGITVHEEPVTVLPPRCFYCGALAMLDAWEIKEGEPDRALCGRHLIQKACEFVSEVLK